MNEEIKKLVSEAKNICLIPSQLHEPESLTATLALFYTLKEMHKNVNLIISDLPQNLAFLTPSVDYISQPKNFVISIPRKAADVSQVYYEKNDDNLKIHLTIDSGTIKKDNISFYFSEAKPDVVITLGIQNFQKELTGKLDSFGFLLDAPIINIDNHPQNQKFGKINLVEETSLSQIILGIITSADEGALRKNTSTCLLAGLMLYCENFHNTKTTPEIFHLCAELMKQGADHQQIMENLYGTKSQTPAPAQSNNLPIINTINSHIA